MDMKIRAAHVKRILDSHGGQVVVTAYFSDGGSQVVSASNYEFSFVTSARTQPKVGSSIYLAFGDLPTTKSPIQALKDDLAAEDKT